MHTATNNDTAFSSDISAGPDWWHCLDISTRGTKWLTFRSCYFQNHFLVWNKLLYFDYNSTIHRLNQWWYTLLTLIYRVWSWRINKNCLVSVFIYQSVVRSDRNTWNNRQWKYSRNFIRKYDIYDLPSCRNIQVHVFLSGVVLETTSSACSINSHFLVLSYIW